MREFIFRHLLGLSSVFCRALLASREYLGQMQSKQCTHCFIQRFVCLHYGYLQLHYVCALLSVLYCMSASYVCIQPMKDFSVLGTDSGSPSWVDHIVCASRIIQWVGLAHCDSLSNVDAHISKTDLHGSMHGSVLKDCRSSHNSKSKSSDNSRTYLSYV